MLALQTALHRPRARHRVLSPNAGQRSGGRPGGGPESTSAYSPTGVAKLGELAIFHWLRKRSPTGGEGGAADEQLRAVGDSVQAAGAAAASAAPPGRISLSERVRLSLNRCVEIQAHHLVHIFKYHVPRFRARSDLTSFEEF